MSLAAAAVLQLPLAAGHIRPIALKRGSSERRSGHRREPERN